MSVLAAGLCFLGFVLFITLITGGLHKIDEGYVGVYYIGGVLSKTITNPGYNVLIPFVTTYHQVQVSVQTDQVLNIPCGTSGGVMIYFDKIEVVNKLRKNMVYDTVKNYTVDYDKIWIYDKIHHEINQFCTKHTLHEIFIEKFDSLDESLVEALNQDIYKFVPSIEILGIRVTKPRIPESIKRNFEEMERQRTQLLIASENQKVKIQEVLNIKQQNVIKAQSKLDVTTVEIENSIREKENEKKLALIENEMTLNRIKSEVDSVHYSSTKDLETLQQRLTPEYLRFTILESLSQNIQLYIGEDIPEYFGGSAETIKKKPKKDD